MRRALLTCLLGAAALGAAGCNEYRYYDVDVSFNIGAGHFSNTRELSEIQICRVTVTGADSRTFYIFDDPRKLPEQFCPPVTNSNPRSRMGIFEYSSHADSGELTFTMDVWDGGNQTDQCHVGSGSRTVPVTDMTTTEGIMLVVDRLGAGCTNPAP